VKRCLALFAAAAGLSVACADGGPVEVGPPIRSAVYVQVDPPLVDSSAFLLLPMASPSRISSDELMRAAILGAEYPDHEAPVRFWALRPGPLVGHDAFDSVAVRGTSDRHGKRMWEVVLRFGPAAREWAGDAIVLDPETRFALVLDDSVFTTVFNPDGSPREFAVARFYSRPEAWARADRLRQGLVE
jgi:hypothetical protein